MTVAERGRARREGLSTTSDDLTIGLHAPTLSRVEGLIVQPRVGADRVGVCRSPFDLTLSVVGAGGRGCGPCTEGQDGEGTQWHDDLRPNAHKFSPCHGAVAATTHNAIPLTRLVQSRPNSHAIDLSPHAPPAEGPHFTVGRRRPEPPRGRAMGSRERAGDPTGGAAPAGRNGPYPPPPQTASVHRFSLEVAGSCVNSSRCALRRPTCPAASWSSRRTGPRRHSGNPGVVRSGGLRCSAVGPTFSNDQRRGVR